ncbi:MAG: 16S rRNA (cytidine(1402)-2'-O)-methyltransferase [Pseudomonadota bacterium]
MSQPALYVIATPIGNLEDLTQRARRILGEVDVLFAEDTRRSQKLLSHLGIRRPLIRCDERAEERAGRRALEELNAGRSVALLSDAGTPLISDPGARLVGSIHEAGFAVVPIPGPSAVTTAISASGFPGAPFVFYGFLPRKKGQRSKLLREISLDGKAAVFFESPQRIVASVTELARWAPGRGVCVGRELTKMHEEILRGSAEDLARRLGAARTIGEFTVVVAPLKKREIRQACRARAMMDEE